MSDLQQWSAEEWERHKRMRKTLQDMAYCPCCDAYLDCFDDCAIKGEALNGVMQDRYNLMMKAREALR